MRLLALKLENFQGIRKAEYRLGGQSTSIYGDNATGKTTIFNAVTWLLFDRASTGAKNFTPKTKGAYGDLHNLDHSAEATFDIDGNHVTLKKVYHEIYKKRRGSAAEEFSGHGVDYYIDGVPTKEKDFQTTLVAYCGDAEKMKMLTMPDYFPEEMAWDKRRTLLLEVCGDIDDEAVITSKQELSGLPDILRMPGDGNQSYSVEDWKKIAQASKTEINRQLQSMPGRIDEAERAIPDTAGIDPVQIGREIDAIRSERDALEQKRADIAGDSGAGDLRQEISATKADLAELRVAYAERISGKNDNLLAEINELMDAGLAESNAVKTARNNSERATRDLERMRELREQLLNDYTAVQNERWDDGAELCPACGQRLPEERIGALRAEYNLNKSRKLETINRRGITEASKDMIAEIESSIAASDVDAERHAAAVAGIEAQISDLRAQLITPAPFETTAEYLALSAKIADLQAQEQNARESAADAEKAIVGEIQALNSKADALRGRKALLQIASSQRKRIDDLKRSEKDLGKRYEEFEYGIYLCDLFTKTKVGMLSDKINAEFKHVRFRLFVEQINGGIKDDCEVMIPTDDGRMVPFAFANHAARINAGLEIINTLSHHWGIEMPVFIDNAESVTRLADTDTQIIRLIVSEQDKQLRVETNSSPRGSEK